MPFKSTSLRLNKIVYSDSISLELVITDIYLHHLLTPPGGRTPFPPNGLLSPASLSAQSCTCTLHTAVGRSRHNWVMMGTTCWLVKLRQWVLVDWHELTTTYKWIIRMIEFEEWTFYLSRNVCTVFPYWSSHILSYPVSVTVMFFWMQSIVSRSVLSSTL